MQGRILITGGTGTLGHAILILAQKKNWNVGFTIFARSELRLAEMKRRFPSIHTVIGDIRDYGRLSAAITGHDGVIHAAAMKRIPECEESPSECYMTNIIGSDNVARASIGKVGWVVGVSTDKACQSVTAYGSSKLMMESIFLSYHKKRTGTHFCLTRYGNVVASNGSIIPLWESQYNSGKRLTITDTKMSRFWMSPFDAVKAINMSLQMPGIIYVPKIASCYMTELAVHLFPNCEFDEIGLRSNEKLHEDLVSFNELSIDREDSFVVGIGTQGNVYRSSTAPHLRIEDFDRMLTEAEEIEYV